MKFLRALCALFVFAFSAPGAPEAQTQTALMGCCNMGPAPVVGGGPPPSYVGPGDLISGATVAYSTRAYNATAAATNAKALAIIRASDNQTCDVQLASGGGLGNVASCSGLGAGDLATFCLADICNITKFYDQTGSGQVALVIGSHSATLVFSCIGTLPCVNTAGTSWYTATLSAAVAQPFTTSTVAIRTGALAAQNDLLGGASATFFAAQVGGVGKVGGFFGATATASEADNAWHAIQIVTNGASSAVAVDATQTTGLNMGANALPSASFLFTQTSAGPNPFTGEITEIIIYPFAFTGAQQSSMCANQHAYWGTPTAC